VKDTLLRVGRYGLTGGAAAVVDLGVFALLCPALLPVGPAATVSFLAAVGVNYTLTSRYVFANSLNRKRFYRFFVFAVLGLLINVSATVAVARLLPVKPVVAKFCGIGIAFFFNYLFNAKFVFDRD